MATFPDDPWAGKRTVTPPRGPRVIKTTADDPAARPGGGMTLDALMLRQKELANQKVPMTDMTSPMQGISYALQQGLQGFQQGQAARDLSTGQQAVGNAFATMGPNGELTPEGKAALARYDPDKFMDLWALEQKKAKQFGEIVTGEAAKALGLDPTKAYQQNLSTQQWEPIGGGGQTINVGGEGADVDFNKEFSKTEADIWTGYQKAAPMASQVIGSMDMIDQLATAAPQGGLTGALAEAFPGFSTAGAAWQAAINDLLPKLKIEGSGAQSDADLGNIRKSMPRLGNNVAANQLISSFVRRKAEQNLKRGQLISNWANGPRDQASQVEVRRQLMAIDSEDLMTPDLRRLVQKITEGEGEPDAATPAPATGGGEGGGGGKPPPKKDPFAAKYGL